MRNIVRTDYELRFVVSSSGSFGFQRFAAHLLRIRHVEADLALEQALRRADFRASLTALPSDEKPNLGPLFSAQRLSGT